MSKSLATRASCALLIALSAACAPIDDEPPEGAEAPAADEYDGEEASADPSGKIDKAGIFTLSVYVNGAALGGYVTGTNDNGGARVITCGTDCSEGFIWDSRVTLRATTSGVIFMGWGGACSGSGTNPVCTVPVRFEGADVWANFAPKPTSGKIPRGPHYVGR